MSVQFGRWNFDGRPVDRESLAKAGVMLAPYGADGWGTYIKDSVGILFRAHHTTKESRSEAQPHITPSGAVLTWDGRLDNRADLIRQLRGVVTIASTDVAIVSAAYECRGSDCFVMLTGDWALSIWDANTRSLILAKDPIGTRHLYYSFDDNQVTWSTILDPLVLFAGKTFALCEEYIAGWLSFFPAAHLTPYVGIHSLPSSSSVAIRAGKPIVSRYWDFDPEKRVRYRTDTEYEEHFRAVFAQAVRRRLRSDSPILAELSGGMDSSSIVCMADTIIGRGAAETPRLDTISYYNDSEPNWDERPYFTKVEEKRGRTGCHIDVGREEPLSLKFEKIGFASTPGSGQRSNQAIREFSACLIAQGNRVVLSGIGGDEVTGGVPTPTPELEDLLAGAEFRLLAHQLKVWALNKRKPWFHLLLHAARGFFPLSFVGLPKHKRPVPWLCPEFVNRNRAALQGYETRLKLFGPRPSFQESLNALGALQRQLQSSPLASGPPYEKRYPFLDRNLLEFLYAVPREQLVRPSQRRSLLRRALAGIVPDELLNRKRKAYVARWPFTAISNDWPALIDLSRQMASSFLGIVEPRRLAMAIRMAGQYREVPAIPLLRTFSIESWLRSLQALKVSNCSSSGKSECKLEDSPRGSAQSL